MLKDHKGRYDPSLRTSVQMMHDIIIGGHRQLGRPGGGHAPALLLDAGEKAWTRYVEFLTANIRNRNTREAYARAITRFSDWCSHRKIALAQVTPFLVAAYIEQLGTEVSVPTVKQHLAALKMLGDYLVTGQVLPMNPASSVRGPKYSIKKGKTPVLTPDQARLLLDSIETDSIIGLRDRALIGMMVFSFARISAALAMSVGDYYPDGKRFWLRLHEKGGKYHEVPAHHSAEQMLDDYLAAAGIAADKSSPLFRSVDKRRQLTEQRLSRSKALQMIKRRARGLPLPSGICNHSFRATGITSFLLGGGTLERAAAIAAHSNPKTTSLYDRRNDAITLDEIERILI